MFKIGLTLSLLMAIPHLAGAGPKTTLPAAGCATNLDLPTTRVLALPADHVYQTRTSQIYDDYSDGRYVNPKYMTYATQKERLVGLPSDKIYYSSVDDYIAVSSHWANGASHLYKVEDRPGEINVGHLPAAAVFPGKVMAASDDLKTFVVDKTLGVMKAKQNGSNYGTTSPDLLIVTRDKNKLSSKTLDRWEQMRASLAEAQKSGLLLRYDDTEAVVSHNGRYLALNLTLATEQSAQTGPISTAYFYAIQNLIGVWDVQENRLVTLFKSSELDTEKDQETNAKTILQGHVGMDRRFKMRLMEDGELVVARVHATPFDGVKSDIYLKTARIKPDQALQQVIQASIGTFTPGNDPNSIRAMGGIAYMHLSRDGRSVIISLTDRKEGELIYVPIPEDTSTLLLE
jgi:hypothetical protein